MRLRFQKQLSQKLNPIFLYLLIRQYFTYHVRNVDFGLVSNGSIRLYRVLPRECQVQVLNVCLLPEQVTQVHERHQRQCLQYSRVQKYAYFSLNVSRTLLYTLFEPVPLSLVPVLELWLH